MAETRVKGVWRAEMEMLAGSETHRNSIDILEKGYVSGDDDPPTGSESIFDDLTQFFVNVYYPDVTIISLTLREIWYHRDPAVPMEHPPLFQEPINLVGVGDTTFGGAHNSNYLPADVCIYCKKTTLGGRNGKMFFRNILTEVDVQSGFAGIWAFSGGAGHFQESVWNTQVTDLLAPYFEGGDDTGPYAFGVTHLEGIKLADSRVPYPTTMTGLVLQRPVTNRAKR